MRASLKANISSVIGNYNSFDQHDFTIIEDKAYNQITIAYEFTENDYLFRFSVPTSKIAKKYEVYDKDTQKATTKTKMVYSFHGFMKPGHFADREEFEFEDLSDLLSNLSIWLQLLENELISLPVKRKLDQHETLIKQIQEKIDIFFDNGDVKEHYSDYLTREEGELLKERLSEIENFLREKIAADQTDEDEKQNELAELRADIEKLNNAAMIMTKKNWLKRFAVNIASWSIDPGKQKRLSYGIKLIENIGRAIGIDMPKISGLLPIEAEKEIES